MGHLSDRADKFTKKFAPPKEEVLSQAEQEAQFARNFSTRAGIKEMYKEMRAKRDAG